MPWPSRSTAIDVGLCAVMSAYVLPPMLDPSVNDPGATVAGPLLLPALLAPVFLRHRFPLGACFALTAGCAVSALPTLNQFRLPVAIPVALLLLIRLAPRASRREAVAGLIAVLAALAIVGATESVLDGLAGLRQMMVFCVPLTGGIFVAGRVIRARERVAAQLLERTEQLQARREATAELAIEIDRARLATDLDDVARARIEEMVALAADEPTREGFGRIETLGRASLDGMRGLLGLLRSTDPGARAPRPTLEQLDALLAEARAGGRVVGLEVEGVQRALGAGVELAAYRTVQYGLTAVGDGTAAVTVTVRYLPAALELEVRGPRRADAAAAVALRAARERVTALGGTFWAPTPVGDDQVIGARLGAVAVNG